MSQTFQSKIAAAAEGQIIWDKGERGSVKGLFLRHRNGRKTFNLFYRTKSGQQRKPKISDYAELTLGEVRRRAKAILDQVAAGLDLKGEWDTSKLEPTIQDLYDRVLKEHWSKVSPKWRKDVENFYKNNVRSPFGGQKLSSLTASDVRAWLSKFEDKPYAGNRSLEVLSKLYQFAIEREILPQGSNPCLLVKALPERKRKRFATAPELKKVFELLGQERETFPRQVAYILMLMFSGSRPSAIARARWDQLLVVEKNGKNYGVLSVHGKSSNATGEDETVVFPPQVMEVLLTLPRVEGETITGLAKVPQKFWDRIRIAAGCPDLWARDFRRTFATVGLSGGLSLDSLGELLNHKSTQTTKIYAKLMDDNRVTAAGSIADKISAIIDGVSV